MGVLYSKSTNSFYDTNINDVIPEDSVSVTEAERQALLTALNSGGSILIDAQGLPVAVQPTAPTLQDLKATLCVSIDSSADAVYIAIGGPSPGRLAEYQQAQTEANAFKAAGYAGMVPPTVQCWATAKGWTGQQACDDILTTAAQWLGALQAIRSARLMGKQAVLNSADEASARAASAAAIEDMQAISA